MLQLEIPEREFFDEDSSTFIVYKKDSIQLEHSLISLSKWESKWCKPFFGPDEKTLEETVDYIKCMTITQNVRPETYDNLPTSIINQVDAYIKLPMTATWITEPQNSPKSKEIITAEIIYHWMIALNIPIEFQKWHLNRLFMLIRVCNIKNQPPKKQNKRDMLNKRNAINQARRANQNSKG